MEKFFKILFLLFIIQNKAFALDELVLKSYPSFVPTFHSKFSFLLGVNPSLQKATEISNFAFSYAKKMDDFWLDSNFLITNGTFDKMTSNNPTATGLADDQFTDTKSSMTTFGVGIGREFRQAQELLPFRGIYEFMAADVTYNIYKETTSGKSFSGPGLLAKYSLFKKFSDFFSAGAGITYNLAVVKRSSENETEDSSKRSLTMSFATVGFDLSFFL